MYARQVAREAERLVALPVLLEDREGQLGERLAHEVVDARFEHIGHRAQAVAVEALPAADADRHDPVVAAPAPAGVDDGTDDGAASGGNPSCART